MWIDALTIEDLFSHRSTALTFDRARPIALFLGRNSSGKTPTAAAVELALTGNVLSMRGTGANVAEMIRNAPEPSATSASVKIVAHATRDSRPVEIRRRVTAKGISTSGAATTKSAYDLFARIHGDADPAAVFSVLCNLTGFFELAASTQETARKQKALLLGLIDQSVPVDAFTAWPPAFGSVPTTFAGIEEAYGLASARLTELRRELDKITVDPVALDDAEATGDLVRQIEAKILEVRGEKERRIAAQGEAAGRRGELEHALAVHRETLVDLRADLAKMGARPVPPPEITDWQAHALRTADVERDLEATRRAQATVDGQRGELARRRAGEATLLERAGTRFKAIPPAAELARRVTAARLAQEEGRVAFEAWKAQGRALVRLRASHEARTRAYALLMESVEGQCAVCRRELGPEERALVTAWYDGELAEATRALAAAEEAMPAPPDLAALQRAVEAAETAQREALDAAQAVHAATTALAETDEHLAVLPDHTAEIARLMSEHVALVQAQTLHDEAEAYDAVVAEIEATEQEVAETEAALAALPEEDPEIAKLEARLTQGAAALGEARRRVAARECAEQAEVQAGRLDAEREALEALRDQLGTKGVRERLLLGRMGALLDRVNEVLSHFDLHMAVREPWEIRLNGQPPALMGETEQMRAGLAFQIALAEVTGARILVADRIGNFDAVNRAALFTVLDQALAKGWLEQALLFSTYTGAQAPTAAPGDHVALYHVIRPAGAPTSIARVA